MPGNKCGLPASEHCFRFTWRTSIMGLEPELPDYRTWSPKGTPLEDVQKRLARRGLSDPWARNEAWRFSGGFAKSITFSNVFFRGFKWGFAAFVVALGVEYALTFPKKDGGHH